ncbi:hypothetical protein [Xenorhabdus bovienii]|uniref:hypothetical protein n=1 Tax=Xenorhabdus bovienii TaxID=40576 RepID=UPI0021583FB2|nr:hypothetical protein [Xenorhabdus bovienii]
MSKEMLSLIDCVKQGLPVKMPAMTGKEFKAFMAEINNHNSVAFLYSAVLSALLFLLCFSKESIVF